MIATDYTRDDCQLGNHRISYAKLQREYRCDECGGRAVVRWSDEGYHPECGRCGGRGFIHEYEAHEQKHKAREMLKHLPADIVQSYLERRKQCQS